MVKSKKTEYFTISTCMDIGITEFGHSLPYVPTYAVKMVDDKCEDIIDINSWKAEEYIKKDAPSFSHNTLLVKLPRRNAWIDRDDVIKYKKNSGILKKKLKEKGMDYLLEAALHLATAPREANAHYEQHFRRADTKHSFLSESEWNEAKAKEQSLFDTAKEIENVLKKRKDRKEAKQGDELENKRDILDHQSEFEAFFEEDAQVAHDKKAQARKKIYTRMLNKKFDKQLK